MANTLVKVIDKTSRILPIGKNNNLGPVPSRDPRTKSSHIARLATMGASHSAVDPLPYSGPVFPPSKTYDIISTHGDDINGTYEIRDATGAPLYYTDLTKAKFGVNISTIHRLNANGIPGEILAACRGTGNHSTRFSVMLGDPYVPGATKYNRHGDAKPRAKEKKEWPKIKEIGTYGQTSEGYVFDVGVKKYRWQRTEDPHFIGSADTYFAHWALYDGAQRSDSVLAVYVHVRQSDSVGNHHVAQLNHYAALAPEVEVIALAVMEGIERRRGTIGYVKPVSSGCGGGGGGPSGCGGGGGCGDGGGGCG